jgi:hypothetical protein
MQMLSKDESLKEKPATLASEAENEIELSDGHSEDECDQSEVMELAETSHAEHLY